MLLNKIRESANVLLERRTMALVRLDDCTWGLYKNDRLVSVLTDYNLEDIMELVEEADQIGF